MQSINNSLVTPTLPAELYRLLFDGSPLPMMLFEERSFRILDVNEAAIRLYGWSREEFVALTVLDIRPPDAIARFRGTLQHPADGTPFPGRYRHWKRDGTIFDVEVAAHRLLMDGEPLRLAMVTDVTERVAAERALLEAYEAVRTLVDHSPLAIVAVDRECRITMWNPAAERIFGYRADEILGHPLPLIPPDRPEEREHLTRLFAEGAPGRINFATRRLRKDGTLVDVLLSTATITGADGMPTSSIGFMSDMTEQRRLELQFQQTQKMEAIGRLAGGVAHDFNNLLQVIITSSELALADAPEGTTLRTDLEEIRGAGARAATLTRQLLSFSRRRPLEPGTICLAATIRGMTGMLNRLLGGQVELEVKIAPDLWPVVADAGQIEQLVMNLVVNARDAIRDGGHVEIILENVAGADPALDPGGRPCPDRVRIAVIDTGVGMDETTKAHIFEPFFTTKPPGEGTGLGLATVYGIVQQSGGTIAVSSSPGSGARFDVLLPRAMDRDESPTAESGASEAGAGAEATILVVDDEPSVRESARRMLERTGYRVLVADNGSDALALLEQHANEIDIVFTDLVMPELGGSALAERMRERGIAIPVIFASGYAEHPVVRHRPLPQGATLLQKPYAIDELRHAIRGLLPVG